MFAGIPTDIYNLGVSQYSERMHPDLPRETRFCGYYNLATGDQKYLAGVIVATRGTPVLLNVNNELPNRPLIPTDTTVMAGPNGQTVGDLPLNRIVTHLHGGHTPWFSDGTPFSGSTRGLKGASFHECPRHQTPRGSANYYYPMEQSARLSGITTMPWESRGLTRT